MASLSGNSWFEIGDPTFLGWVTSLAYLAAALYSWRAAQSYRFAALAMKISHPHDAMRFSRLAAGWRGMAVVLILLGLNKELDLAQKLVLVWGKTLASNQGWYESRGTLQRGFVVLMVLLAAGVLAAAFHYFREVRTRIIPATVGVACIVAYTLLRAIVFHVQGAVPELVASSLWVLELAGIFLVLWCAARTARRKDARQP